MKYKNASIVIVLIYLWYLVVDPTLRFPFLAAIHLERIIVAVGILSLFLGHRFRPRFTILSALILTFYIWLLMSYFFSQYKDNPFVQYWLNDYWKYIVFYFLVLYSIDDVKDVFTLFAGFVVILFVYQAHSWLDFLRGGSYVWQQGIKRIVGIWTSGIGAANAFAMICLLVVPFGYFWLNITESKKIRLFMIAFLILSFLSITFSGTRGALIGILFFVLINIRGWKQVTIAVVAFLLITISVYLFLPNYLQERFLGLIVEKKENVITKTDEIEKESAESRLEGLVDGWKLAKLKPVFGWGPGSSPIVRSIVDEKYRYSEESYLQLHNLYGQLLSETGIGGAIIFFIIILMFFVQLRATRKATILDPKIYQFKLALQNVMLLMLFYGNASHTLYRFHWFFFFALADGLLLVLPDHIREVVIYKELEPDIAFTQE